MAVLQKNNPDPMKVNVLNVSEQKPYLPVVFNK